MPFCILAVDSARRLRPENTLNQFTEGPSTVRIIRLIMSFTLAVSFLVGCTANPQAPARITGSVSYKGGPVPAGTVVFHTTEQGSYTAQLNANGSYEVRDVPKGKLVVTVETESVNPNTKTKAYGGDKGSKMYEERLRAEGRAAAEKAPPQQYVKIPARYASQEKSPLNVEVSAGSQTHNFTLTDD